MSTVTWFQGSHFEACSKIVPFPFITEMSSYRVPIFVPPYSVFTPALPWKKEKKPSRFLPGMAAVLMMMSTLGVGLAFSKALMKWWKKILMIQTSHGVGVSLCLKNTIVNIYSVFTRIFTYCIHIYIHLHIYIYIYTVYIYTYIIYTIETKHRSIFWQLPVRNIPPLLM